MCAARALPASNRESCRYRYVKGSATLRPYEYMTYIHSFIDFIQAFHTPSRTCSWFTNLFNCSFNPAAEFKCFIWAPATINTAATSYYL